MSINAADIMRQMYDTAEAVRTGKLDPESAHAVAQLGGKQIDVMRTVVDYMRVANDAKVTEIGGDVFVGAENPKALTHGNSR